MANKWSDFFYFTHQMRKITLDRHKWLQKLKLKLPELRYVNIMLANASDYKYTSNQ